MAAGDKERLKMSKSKAEKSQQRWGTVMLCVFAFGCYLCLVSPISLVLVLLCWRLLRDRENIRYVVYMVGFLAVVAVFYRWIAYFREYTGVAGF